MKRCLVVGAGGFGREALSWALHVDQSDWRLEGFLDANPDATNGKFAAFPVVGDPARWKPASDEVFIAGIGDPATRLRVCGELMAKGAQFLTIVHPSVIFAPETEIGLGCVVAPNAVISANVKLGDFVLVNIAASLGHDSCVGEGTTISCHCDIMGFASVGRCCFLGSHASILPAKKVGDYAIVGAGSVVVRNVHARTTVMGVPAQTLVAAAE